MTSIVFRTKVAKVERKSRVVRAWKEGDDVKIVREDLGWFVRLDGSWEAIRVGDDGPGLEVGDLVEVKIVKIEETI